MIGFIVGIVLFVFVVGYVLFGVCGLPYYVYTAIKGGTFFDKDTIPIYILFVLILLALIIIAIRIGKNSSDARYIDVLKVFMGISIPVYYLLSLLISFISKDKTFLDILLFKNGILNSIGANISFYCLLTTIPSIVASSVVTIFAKRNIKKQVELEAAREYIENENKKQAEKTSKTIEYYKKLDDIKRLLDSGTITKDKFEELKLDLMIQYNIDED